MAFADKAIMGWYLGQYGTGSLGSRRSMCLIDCMNPGTRIKKDSTESNINKEFSGHPSFDQLLIHAEFVVVYLENFNE